MVRRLAIAFVVIASLTSQASAGVAYACGMMGGATTVLSYCCCHPDTAAPCQEAGGSKSCCQIVPQISVAGDEQTGDIAAPVKLPDYNPHLLTPALLPALPAVTLPVQSHKALWAEASNYGHYGTNLYLRTQRLRI